MNCKVIHCGMDFFSERETQSIQQLKSLGLRYIRIENEPYNQPAPLDKIFKGWINFYKGSNKDYNESGLTDRHYGAWLSHKQAVLLSFSDDDHSLICEADCRILNLDIFKERLVEAIRTIENHPQYPIVRFESLNYSKSFWDVGLGKKISDNIFECEKIFGPTFINSDNKIVYTRYVGEQHVKEDCYGYLPSAKEWLLNLMGNERPQWMIRVTKLEFED